MTKRDRLPPGWREHPDKAIEAIRLERLYRIGCAHGAQGEPATGHIAPSETRVADTNPARTAGAKGRKIEPPLYGYDSLVGSPGGGVGLQRLRMDATAGRDRHP